jgi:N-acetylmuramoyl-L-alanine amidase
MTPRTFVLDAGHGGDDRGGRSLGIPESRLVLPYAVGVALVLRDAGHRVILTRTGDESVALSARARIANEAGADLFVSLHANASDDATARGPWTLYAAPSTRGAAYAAVMQRTLARVLGGNPRAAYPDASPAVDGRTLAVLRQTRMTALLLELGFMTHASDLGQLESERTRLRVSAAVACTLVELTASP